LLKNLPNDGLNRITEIIQDFWTNPDCDFATWHVQKLITLYKGKGDQKDPNNWRGICLKETTAKIVSIIIAERLLHQLEQIGAPTQFGHIGCQEALHSLRTILMTRRHHGLETYVLFIDLVKAFDSINYDIMYRILARYGIPEPLIEVIRKMYSNCYVQMTVGKESEQVSYGAGVQQGDNMAPLLFLLVMQAAIETFEHTQSQPKLEF